MIGYVSLKWRLDKINCSHKEVEKEATPVFKYLVSFDNNHEKLVIQTLPLF